MTVGEAKKYGRQILKTKSPTPELDTDCIIGDILGWDKTKLLFCTDQNLEKNQEEDFIQKIQKRSTGFPVAYINGHKEFYGRDFLVTPDVLIPKPDTEILVENALKIISEKYRQLKRPLTVCDMCTGSGCVGLSILKSCYEEKITLEQHLPILTLADISDRALDVAKKNYNHLGIKSLPVTVHFIRSNLFENVPGKFDLIVSNPPYIPFADVKELLKDGRAEPVLALNGDINSDGTPSDENDGLMIIKNLIPQAHKRLNERGVLILETGEYNADETENLMCLSGFFDTQIFLDLEGQKRNVLGRLPNPV